ncbi:MAG: hypothetical protein ACJAZR_002212, partial [Sediminicola sp.]
KMVLAQILRAIQKNWGYHFSEMEKNTKNGKNKMIGKATKI